MMVKNNWIKLPRRSVVVVLVVKLKVWVITPEVLVTILELIFTKFE